MTRQQRLPVSAQRFDQFGQQQPVQPVGQQQPVQQQPVQPWGYATQGRPAGVQAGQFQQPESRQFRIPVRYGPDQSSQVGQPTQVGQPSEGYGQPSWPGQPTQATLAEFGLPQQAAGVAPHKFEQQFQPQQFEPQQPVQQFQPRQFEGARMAASATTGQPSTRQQPTQWSTQQAMDARESGGQQSAGGYQDAMQQFAPAQPKPTTSPYVDLFDTPEELLVVADLPGCGPEDVDLQVSKNSLRIIGERSAEEEHEGNVIQRERLQRAERVIELPTGVDAENAEASCENGVVRVHLPKVEDDRERHIGVQ